MLSDAMKYVVSAMTMALIFLSTPRLYAHLPASIYTVPEGEALISVKSALMKHDDLPRRGEYGIGLGLTSTVALYLSMESLHRNSESTAGDFTARLTWYLGEMARDRLVVALNVESRLPVGPDARESDRWRSIANGAGQFSLRPAFYAPFENALALRGSLGYTLRAASDEELMRGIHLNPLKRKTWTSVAGINPLHEDALLFHERMNNDYVDAALAFVWQFHARFHCIVGISGLYGFTRGSDVAVPGEGIDLLMADAALRWEINRYVMAETALQGRLATDSDYPPLQVALGLSLLF